MPAGFIGPAFETCDGADALAAMLAPGPQGLTEQVQQHLGLVQALAAATQPFDKAGLAKDALLALAPTWPRRTTA